MAPLTQGLAFELARATVWKSLDLETQVPGTTIGPSSSIVFLALTSLPILLQSSIPIQNLP